ncbi:WD40 repeat-like protein [Microthyrium microscopicum]|uniref:WD40 repeat-like protein n=1 Tax=Microthyrium microscopicum TaxID=703497 RepID=A0A6A6TVR4_9PEZI|nr:WD40 repeat-like protein [Microthyrium microscopicum]
MENNPLHAEHVASKDFIQERLDSVTRRLARPAFLHDISCSRLPSQAASESSLSPAEPPHFLQQHPQAQPVHHGRRRAFGYGNSLLPSDALQRSPLHQALDFAHIDDPLDDCDLIDSQTPLIELAQAVLEHDPKVDEVTPSTAWVELRRLQDSFSAAWASLCTFNCALKMAVERGFSTFEHGHNDLVLAVDFNFYGTRMVTASADHRLKVFDRKDEAWEIVDTWRAHDAEVVDVKWNGPFIGSTLGSIGEDGRFTLWEEDLLEPPNSGRRFKRIASIRSGTKMPYCSLDFKNIQAETYIALITRDGLLSIYEPVDHDNLGGDMTVIMKEEVCASPSRQEETGFRVAWHKEKLPCWTAVEAGLDRKALSLAVAAMDKVKIYRTDKERKWYQAAELVGARGIIRDVAWANGAMRGYDVIATASKDGAVRVYDVTTPIDHSTRAGADSSSLEPGTPPAPAPGKPRITAPSGLAVGLANTSGLVKDQYRNSDKNVPGRIRHEAKMVAELTAHNGSVWRVAFSQLGDLLVSTGDDGSVRTWKKALNGLSGQWLEYAQIDMTSQDG